jgi:hypothetical protein
MKTCTACQQSKALADFYRHPKIADGHLSQCKACVKTRVRQHRRLNESVREYDRKRGARQSTTDLQSYRERYPDAYRAHTAVSNAVRDGRLKKEPCLFCNDERVHGHHRDYSEPLVVIWLCARCHHRLHANFPETAAHEPKHQKAA